MHELEAPEEVRCECSRRPLLARAGIEGGSPFLWVRHTKSSKIMMDVKIEGGTTRIVCRECLRTLTITLGARMEIERS